MGFTNPSSSGGGVVTPVSVPNGGTGLSSVTSGDILYASAANTISRLAKGTGLQRLRMNAGASAPEWFTDAGSATNFAAVHAGADGSTTYYGTLAAAKAAAVSGDTIEVYAGTYNEKNLLKNGVNWVFHDGANVVYTSNGNGALFDDGVNGANGVVTCIIEGYGNFTNSGTGTSNYAINIDNASDITFSGKLVKSTVAHSILANAGTLTIPWIDVVSSTVASGYGLYAGSTATVSGSIRSITSNGNSASKALSTTGATTLFTNEILGGGMGVECAGGTLQLDAYSINSSFNCAIRSNGAGTYYVRALSITATGSAQNGIRCSAGTLFVTSDVISATGNSGACWTDGGTCYINADTITSSSAYEPAVFTDSGSMAIESFLIKQTDGAQPTVGGTGGTLRIVSSKVQNTGTNGIAAKAGGQTLSFEGYVALVSAAGATDGITAAAAQNVKLYGFVCSNKAKNANITFQVSPAANQVFGDANVV